MASPFSTGNGGGTYEGRAQAYYGALMLAGAPFLGIRPSSAFAVIQQAERMGYRTDDFVICHKAGPQVRRILVQVKHSLTMTKKTTEFNDVLADAWRDTHNKVCFDLQHDRIIWILARPTNTQRNHYKPFLEKLKRHTYSSFESMLTEQGVLDQDERHWFETCRDSLRESLGLNISDEATFCLLKCITIVIHDIDDDTSQESSALFNAIYQARIDTDSRSPQEWWAMWLSYVADSNKDGGILCADTVPCDLLNYFKKHTVPPNSALPSTVTGNSEWQIKFRGTQSIDGSAVQKFLIRITGDKSLKIKGPESRSNIVTIESARRSYVTCGGVFAKDLLNEIDGISIEAIFDNASKDLYSAILDSFSSASSILATYPIGDAKTPWIKRSEQQKIEEIINTSTQSQTLLLGVPGCGKSALLSKLYRNLSNSGYTILAIKADSLPGDIVDQRTLAHSLGLHTATVAESIDHLLLNGCNKLLVIIDQLDALAHTSDLRSERLNTLLNLFHELTLKKTVHIIASSRDLEYRFDSRLAQVQADPVHLGPPEKTIIEDLLRALGYQALPPALLEMLRIPQRLRIFQSTYPPDCAGPWPESYPQLLAIWWERIVKTGINSEQRVRIVENLVNELRQAQCLWMPVPKSLKGPVLEQLCKDQILRIGTDGISISLEHQTLYSWISAHMYINNAEAFIADVIESQNSLFGRPRIWAGLEVLWECNKEGFLRVWTRIWKDQTIRHHIRELFARFLGQINDPSYLLWEDFKWGLQTGALQVPLLKAAIGNKPWIERLTDEVIPTLIRNPGPVQNACILIMRESWTYQPRKTYELICEKWTTCEADAIIATNCLPVEGAWIHEAINAAVKLSGTVTIGWWYLDKILCGTSLQDSKSSANILENGINRLWRNAVERDLEVQKSFSKKTPDKEGPEGIKDYFSRYDEHRRGREERKKLIENKQFTGGIETLAKCFPAGFITVAWTWLERVLKDFIDSESGTSENYASAGELCILENSREHSEDSDIVSAIITALDSLATSDPKCYRATIQEKETCSILELQRILARSLTNNAKHYSALGVDFLLSDKRRLRLGDITSRSLETKALIKSLGSHADQDEVHRLQIYILKLEADYSFIGNEEQFVDRAKSKRHIWKKLNSFKYTLLESIEDKYHVQEARDFIESHASQAGRYVEMVEVVNIRANRNDDGMSLEQMMSARSEDLISYLSKKGRDIENANTFGIFASRQPHRIIDILKELPLKESEGFGCVAIEYISRDEGLKPQVYDFVRKMDSIGYSSEQWRIVASTSIYGYVENGDGVPEDIILLLKSWMRKEWNWKTDRLESESHKERQRQSSLLRNDSFIRSIPQGPVNVLEALGHIYLTSKPPRGKEWLAELRDHCDRPDCSTCWRWLAQNHLAFLKHVGIENGEGILFQIIGKYPSVLESIEGTQLLARAMFWITPTAMEPLISKLEASHWDLKDQAVGELMPLLSVTEPHVEWSNARLRVLLDNLECTHSLFRTGIAYSSVLLWLQGGRYRSDALELFRKLQPNVDNSSAEVVADLFRLADDIVPDSLTRDLLIMLLPYSDKLFAKRGGPWLVQHLQNLIPHLPKEVSLFGLAAIRAAGNAFGDIQTSWAADVNEWLQFSITLMRVEQCRNAAIEIFEALLMCEALGLDSTVAAIDERVVQVSSTSSIRTRRRQRRKVTG